MKVGATELPAGNYKVTWTGSGASTEVTLTQGKTKATAPAQLVEVNRKNDAVSTRSENGERVLMEIQFRKQTLVLQNTSGSVAGQ